MIPSLEAASSHIAASPAKRVSSLIRLICLIALLVLPTLSFASPFYVETGVDGDWIPSSQWDGQLNATLGKFADLHSYIVLHDPSFQDARHISSIAAKMPHPPVSIVDLNALEPTLKRYPHVSQLALLDVFLRRQTAAHLVFHSQTILSTLRSSWTFHVIAPYHLDPPYVSSDPHIHIAAHRCAMDVLRAQLGVPPPEAQRAFRERVEWKKRAMPLYSRIGAHAQEKPDGTYVIDASRLARLPGKPTYLWSDPGGQPLFVLKCRTRDPAFFDSNEDRTGLPAAREAAASEIAAHLGVSSVAPQIVMAVVESTAFPGHKLLSERFCSVQEWIPDAREFHAMQDHNLHAADVENAMMLLWVLRDCDAHAGNVLVQGSRLYTVDHDRLLAPTPDCPNVLVKGPIGERLLSDSARAKIQNLVPHQLSSILEFYGLSSLGGKLRDRVTALQKIVANSSLSLKEIHDLLQ